MLDLHFIGERTVMSFNVPNTFVAGTKAKADEVNENFASLQNEINKNAQTMVGIKQDIDYIKNDFMDCIAAEIQMFGQTQKSKFSINSAHLAEDGKTPDVLDGTNPTILAFKVGGEYPVLIATNAAGESETFESIPSVDISGYTSGLYSIFLTLSGTAELFEASVYRSLKAPSSPVINDVWLMTFEPWASYKYNGVSWVEYDGIPLGTADITSGEIYELKNGEFNTQYLDSDCNFLTKRGRENISKRFESNWFTIDSKTAFTLNHNLNIKPERYTVKLLARVKSTIGNYSAGDILNLGYCNFNGNVTNSELGCILRCTNNAVTVGMGNSDYACYNDFGGTGYYGLRRDNLQYKIIVTQDVN